MSGLGLLGLSSGPQVLGRYDGIYIFDCSLSLLLISPHLLKTGFTTHWPLPEFSKAFMLLHI
jgi:hypothetical protein